MDKTDGENIGDAFQAQAPWHDEEPYDTAFFAAKYGLTLKAAEIIIYANGPSRNMCDAGAAAFLRAVALRRDRKLSLPLD